MIDERLALSKERGTLIKRRHLEFLAYNLVSVTYWEWDGLLGMVERRKYRARTLR